MFRRRSITAFFAALYILAAVRAVVPGLCQTQAAVRENVRQQSCCASEPCPPDEGGRPSLHEKAPPHPPCPLCLLAAAPREPLAHVAVDQNVVAWYPAGIVAPSFPRLPLLPLSTPGRSPPPGA